MPLCIVVDDHGDTREGFAEYLRHSGFDVRTAGDSSELRAILAEVTPAAVLMDVQMPLVDGGTLTREIKENERTRQTRVLVISVPIGEEFRGAADMAGAHALLAKPC